MKGSHPILNARTPLFFAAAFLALAASPLAARAQITSPGTLRIATWNVTDYTATSTSRDADFKTAIYGAYQGRALTPDVLLGQEFHDATAVSNFVALLNTAPGSPGDWNAAPFINGPDTDSTFFHRTSRVAYQATTLVSAGSSAAGQLPRNTYRYDLQIVGAATNSSLLSCYSVHMKAGDTDADQAERLTEAARIRDNAQALPAGRNFLVAGDFNIQRSSQAAYQELVGSQANNAGRFFDPINTPGDWNNSSAFRFVHTQDPAGASGMDDRLDQILLGISLGDGANLDYWTIGATARPPIAPRPGTTPTIRTAPGATTERVLTPR